jgi:hypothetical protein
MPRTTINIGDHQTLAFETEDNKAVLAFDFRSQPFEQVNIDTLYHTVHLHTA